MNTFFEQISGGELAEEPAYSVETVASRERLAARRTTAPRTTIHQKRATESGHTYHHQTLEESDEEGELTVDIYDAGDSIVIQSTVAGVKPEDLDVSITDDTIIIRGRRVRSETVDEAKYYYKELFWGSFSRSVILPEAVEENATEATLQHGLLTVRLPKKQQGVTQKIRVKMN